MMTNVECTKLRAGSGLVVKGRRLKSEGCELESGARDWIDIFHITSFVVELCYFTEKNENKRTRGRGGPFKKAKDVPNFKVVLHTLRGLSS